MKTLIKENRGSVTVLLLCILLPLLIFECVIIDVMRMLSCKQSAGDAADLAVNGVLADYNHTLKDYYGIFALADGGRNISRDGNRFFKGSISSVYNSNVTTNVVQGSSLDNEDIFKTQILEFEKYYAGTSLEHLNNIMINLDHISPMIQILVDKLEYEEQLFAFQMDINDLYKIIDSNGSYGFDIDLRAKVVSQMQILKQMAKICEDYMQVWKNDLLLLDLPSDIRNSMEANIMQFSGVISETGVQKAIEQILQLDSLDFVQHIKENTEITELSNYPELNYIFKQCVAVDLLDREHAWLMLDNLTTYGNMDNWSFYGYGDYEDYCSVAPTEIEHKTVFRNFQLCLENAGAFNSAIRNLQETKSYFDDVDKINQMLEACDSRILLEEYAANMFGAFYYNAYNLLGKPVDVFYKNLGSEMEYLAFGNAKPEDNIRNTFAFVLNLSFASNAIQYITINQQVQNASEVLALEMTGKDNLATPYYKDYFCMLYAAKDSHEHINEFGNYGYYINTYRGDDYDLYMSYSECLRYLYLRELALNGEENFIARMRSVMDINMRGNGQPDFSFSNAYTMVSIQANVQMPSNLLYWNQIKLNDVGGY